MGDAWMLAVDVGNSEVVVGLGDDARWLARWRLSTDARRAADEYVVQLAALFALAGQCPAQVGAVVLSSVVPPVTPVLVAVCERLFRRSPLVVGPGVRTGMAIRYEPPAALGTDRLVDAVAARARFGAPVVAVDFGTATTFNVVGPDGTFLGGAIAPGIGVASEAMARAGARLPRIDLAAVPPPPVIGRSSEESMRSGVVYGFAGLVSGLLRRIDDELAALGVSGCAPVVATGGRSRMIAPLVSRIGSVLPDLTLDGLRLILELQSR